jgi:hypothetical protein
VNLGELLRSFGREYDELSRKERGLSDDTTVVGLTDSTVRLGKPVTRGSGQKQRDRKRTCWIIRRG